MLGKCLNPGCLKTFHYFGQGRVYLRTCNCGHVPRGREMSLWPDCAGPLEYFWLCEQCCQSMTLAFDHDGRPEVRERHGLLPSGAPLKTVA